MTSDTSGWKFGVWIRRLPYSVLNPSAVSELVSSASLAGWTVSLAVQASGLVATLFRHGLASHRTRLAYRFHFDVHGSSNLCWRQPLRRIRHYRACTPPYTKQTPPRTNRNRCCVHTCTRATTLRSRIGHGTIRPRETRECPESGNRNTAAGDSFHNATRARVENTVGGNVVQPSVGARGAASERDCAREVVFTRVSPNRTSCATRSWDARGAVPGLEGASGLRAPCGRRSEGGPRRGRRDG